MNGVPKALRFLLMFAIDNFEASDIIWRMDFRYPDKPTTATPEAIAKLRECDYIAQWKYDGWRLQIYNDGGLHLLTRVGESILINTRARFPNELMVATRGLMLPEGSVIDAEFVGPRGTHKPSLYIFDCLKWDGEWLARKTYEQRWEICKRIDLPSVNIQLAHTINSGFLAEFERLKKQWNDNGRGMDLTEGIVVKWKRGRMSLDRSASTKSRAMFKCKFRDIRDQRY